MNNECEKQKNCFSICKNRNWQKTFLISDGLKDLFSNDICKIIYENVTFDYDENLNILKIIVKSGGQSFICDDLDNCKNKLQEIIKENFYLKSEVDELLNTKQDNDKYFEITNGTQAWANPNITLWNFLDKSIISSRVPLSNKEYTNKKYVDDTKAPKEDGLNGSGFFTIGENYLNFNSEKSADFSQGSQFNVPEPLSSNSATTKSYVDNSLSNKQNSLTTGDNISIDNNIISSRPTHTYFNGSKVMSGFDEEKQFTSINDLFNELKERCGNRGSGYLQLFIQDQNENNNRAYGYVWRHYNQQVTFYEIKIVNLDKQTWFTYQSNFPRSYLVNYNFIFRENSNSYVLISSNGESLVEYKSGSFSNGWNGSSFDGSLTQYYVDSDDDKVKSLSVSNETINSLLNRLKFTINMGFQIGYNASTYRKQFESNKKVYES